MKHLAEYRDADTEGEPGFARKQCEMSGNVALRRDAAASGGPP